MCSIKEIMTLGVHHMLVCHIPLITIENGCGLALGPEYGTRARVWH